MTTALAPYKRPPAANAVAMVVSPHYMVDEAGQHLRTLAHKGLTIYGSWPQIRPWWSEGLGSLVCWESRRLRWIHPAGAEVFLLPELPQGPDGLEALTLWAEGLRGYGASPRSLGATSTSLYRAVSSARVLPYRRGVPRLVVMGGRVGSAVPPGSYTGPLVQWDLPAAYAAEIGSLRYGGNWVEHLNAPAALDQFSSAGMCVFAHASIRVPPSLAWGPVPRRPRKELRVWQQVLRPLRAEVYPTGKLLRGVWAWEEVMAARDVGCVVKVDRVWIHHGGRRVFGPWFDAILALRSLPGYAGTLGKLTGNAFFGQLIVRDGALTRKRRMPNGTVEIVPLPRTAARRPRHIHAAEVVTARVRAQMFAHILDGAGPALHSFHTDGAWVYADDGAFAPPGWRQKNVATAMDFLDPQTYVYRHADGRKVWVFSGVDPEDRKHAFDEYWALTMADNPRAKRKVR